MIFRRLEFSGFLPFRQHQVLPLADLGFVIVQGRNEVSSAADSNGVGKTSLWHALSYAPFGQTLDDRKGDDVACRFTKDQCLTKLVLEDDRGEWSIERGRRPKVLRLTGFDGLRGDEEDKELQRLIDDRLGFGFLTFRNAVVFAQGRFERFAQADQSTQMEMLDEIQGLDLSIALDRAKAWRDSIATSVDKDTRALNLLESLQLERRQQLESLQSAERSFVKERADRIAQCEKEESTAKTNFDEAIKQWSKYKKVERDLEDAKLVLADVSRAVATIRQLESDLVSLGTDGQFQYRIDSEQESLSDLLRNKTCPTCYSTLDAKWRTRAKGIVDGRIKAIQADAAQVIKKRAPLVVQITKLQELINAPDDPGGKVNRLETELRVGRTAAQRDMTAKEQTFENAVKALQGAKSVVWSSAAAMKTIEESIQSGDQEAKRLASSIARSDRTLIVAQYWVEAFGDRGIRSLLVDSVAGYLGERMIYHLEQLAAGEASMQLSALKQLKSGGTRERLTITTAWAWGGLNTGSNGQDRRVDLALFAALQDLAEAQSARAFPIRVWDEPGDALDTRGRELFLEWVSKEARRRGSGFLTTHASDLVAMAAPDGIWTVVMDSSGARIEIE